MYSYQKDLERIIIQADRTSAFDAFHIRKLISECKRKTNKKLRILDIGCGDGYLTYSRYSTYHNVEVVGIDREIQSIERAKQAKYGSRFKFEVADIKTYSTSIEYDIISAFNTFHHLENPTLVIKRLWSLLIKSGFILIRNPDDHFKISYPYDPILKLLIEEYNLKSKSDRYQGEKIFEFAKTLKPSATKVNVFFLNECTINMSRNERKDFFADIFNFRINLVKEMSSDRFEYEVDSYRKKFINDQSYFFSSSQLLTIIQK